MVRSSGYTYGRFEWEGRDPNESIRFETMRVGLNFLETMGIEMKEGRSFSLDFPSDTASIILNESGLKATRLQNPIGKTFGLWGKEYRIIGIIKDFNYESLHEPIKPILIRLRPKETQRIMVRIEAGKEREVLGQLEHLYKQFNPDNAFEYTFLDNNYQTLYTSEMRVASLSKYFAGLAILISCLGLFGLAAFTAEKRTKEISIRKILGSSNFAIVTMLSSDFTKMVLVAILFALPLSYYMATKWLEGFAYRIDLQIWYFAGAGVIALLIAWFTIGIQTIKASRINPIDRLKTE
jgi:hypothetical protein